MTSAFKVYKVTSVQNTVGFNYKHYEITPLGSAVVCFGDIVCAIQHGTRTSDDTKSTDKDQTLALVVAEYKKQLATWRPFRCKFSYNEQDQTLTFLAAPATDKGL